MELQSVFKVAEIQLSYKPKLKPSQRPKIAASSDAYNILKESWDEMKMGFLEEFKIILVNRANKVLGICPISLGGVSGTVADPKLIFAAALKASASGIILAHNHPSGNLKPSQQDINLTKKLVDGGSLLDISVLDHIILNEEGYYSFGDEGLI